MNHKSQPILTTATLILTAVASTALAKKKESYPRHPDSKRQAGVPKGKVTEHVFKESKVFPETIRRYWVYVPAQYDGKKPAALMVFQDGHTYVSEKGDFRVPIVFDNLIHKKQMPVTVGLFVNPGHRGDKLPKKRGWAAKPNNRSVEYDTVSDAYARFLIEELIPHVRRSKQLNLSDRREDRAIGGISSGGICAFTAAWHRPDYFSKVLSHIGSFTNIRGGHVYPALIRKTKPKPIRVFLQDGENDLDDAHGNWWLSNLQRAAALKYAN
ncbi:MAG: alpha/beta hydrolase-fold protein, partial [Phycisphaeraceae bacterium]|nr:alpha/beta hydrolase-fold protein [Phycisphaeraceae bacterium]